MSSPEASQRWHARSEKLASIPVIPVLAIKYPKELHSTSKATANSPTTFSPFLTSGQTPDDMGTRGGLAAALAETSPLGQRNSSSNGTTPVSDDGQCSGETEVVCTQFQYHENSDSCECPMCKLTLYISYVYRDQRRASPHVMAARPSPEYVMAPDGSLPILTPIYKPDGVSVCPVYAAFAFCPFLSGCFLPHDEASCASARVLRLASAEEEVARLTQRARELQGSDVWACDVCGYSGIDEFCEAALGTEHHFRQCPRCTFMCFFPYITYLVEHILRSVGDDYQLYKTEVDRYRGLLPDLFKIPLTFEAHRVANIVFAWSLLSPVHARDAMNSIVQEFPNVEAIISVGSGAGYVEHVFNRVMHQVPLQEEWAVDRKRFPTMSFDNVRCDFYGERTIPIFAFDALALKKTYSVHVSMGGPISLYSLNCKQSVLLLCWPPFGSREREESSMGFEALEYYTREGGTMLIYIGDTAATGDWRFHMLLKSYYKLIRNYPVRRELRRWCPQEMGFVYGGNDTIGVYRLRETPLPSVGLH
ncbi:conserved hypothetical protein [Leishmania braziliensis MHOM/BR/75/M2904]|uniref:C3H1-type domain-containing protein n=2 Tax=Leishmania braziliensis TaxID=5660 RepID=A4HGC7_LEIBR|nr:conserved hypothetical protein [Leishmania braziliensis MHOM/BR/75/M2904]KAI5685726.1 hypothetical protein MNV84_05216 [Leishmania braziliensis]CAJ2475727.1 unnamed protein product [Leishmania braziliensis]CAJ2476225.1 unnamed protein product [Leishmania braziliensis]CAM39619.1 conserved hypothetical protein [Leishmania braziliensis MHOM/BR/75/M2904]SYZ67278.1 hypothetical_protein [Leishmania braziliensis MHOM/BR/75/M2904]